MLQQYNLQLFTGLDVVAHIVSIHWAGGIAYI